MKITSKEICCVCEREWVPRDGMNFHNLCNDCFGIYDRLKRDGRMAERTGGTLGDDERFFAWEMFPFVNIEASANRERLKRIVEHKKKYANENASADRELLKRLFEYKKKKKAIN